MSELPWVELPRAIDPPRRELLSHTFDWTSPACDRLRLRLYLKIDHTLRHSILVRIGGPNAFSFITKHTSCICTESNIVEVLNKTNNDAARASTQNGADKKLKKHDNVDLSQFLLIQMEQNTDNDTNAVQNPIANDDYPKPD